MSLDEKLNPEDCANQVEAVPEPSAPEVEQADQAVDQKGPERYDSMKYSTMNYSRAPISAKDTRAVAKKIYEKMDQIMDLIKPSHNSEANKAARAVKYLGMEVLGVRRFSMFGQDDVVTTFPTNTLEKLRLARDDSRYVFVYTGNVAEPQERFNNCLGNHVYVETQLGTLSKALQNLVNYLFIEHHESLGSEPTPMVMLRPRYVSEDGLPTIQPVVVYSKRTHIVSVSIPQDHSMLIKHLFTGHVEGCCVHKSLLADVIRTCFNNTQVDAKNEIMLYELYCDLNVEKALSEVHASHSSYLMALADDVNLWCDTLMPELKEKLRQNMLSDLEKLMKYRVEKQKETARGAGTAKVEWKKVLDDGKNPGMKFKAKTTNTAKKKGKK